MIRNVACWTKEWQYNDPNTEVWFLFHLISV